jgi:hypothetical protein
MNRYLSQLVTTLCVAGALWVVDTTARADIITFNTDPFAGSAALSTPGRQIVGMELFTDFDIASDRFALDRRVFGFDGSIHFANDLVGNLPPSGLNVVVLQTFDNDGIPATPFLAGIAANLIAEQITAPGPGFFVYFNSNLDLPRLVFSTDLSDNTADLKVLARLQNLTGADGRAAIPTITSANFQAVPDTANSLLLFMMAGGTLLVSRYTILRKKPQD